ncbi:SDR family oxidoreductase [uncultured Vibrio sp.]|uniref:SDR family oxidoreductase n=1 Tax=uncultured Vibrio sp. TaxID=114054 RepID=UPI00091918EC|nr:SDR family oxidoreductase [uncultured Vibrio sp.]OIQ25862.1 MAG: short-chain dehydrogenase [Vibrio sp. MedPE-SWchi]
MKTVFITGGNRGIGLSLVKRYLHKQWQVHTTYREERSSQELLALATDNSNLVCHHLDVTNYAQLPALSDALPELDLLINSAGYYGPKGSQFGQVSVEEWRQVFEINTIAPLKLVEALYPNLLASNTRFIACLSSKVGSIAENTSGGGYIYRSSKAALNSVVKSLSNDLSNDGFTVLALHPGWVKTEMGGPNALIDTETSAQGLIQVIDTSNSDVSGHFFNFDGTEIDW